MKKITVSLILLLAVSSFNKNFAAGRTQHPCKSPGYMTIALAVATAVGLASLNAFCEDTYGMSCLDIERAQWACHHNDAETLSKIFAKYNVAPEDRDALIPYLAASVHQSLDNPSDQAVIDNFMAVHKAKQCPRRVFERKSKATHGYSIDHAKAGFSKR